MLKRDRSRDSDIFNRNTSDTGYAMLLLKRNRALSCRALQSYSPKEAFVIVVMHITGFRTCLVTIAHHTSIVQVLSMLAYSIVILIRTPDSETIYILNTYPTHTKRGLQLSICPPPQTKWRSPRLHFCKDFYLPQGISTNTNSIETKLQR